jgi:hypothetical protein
MCGINPQAYLADVLNRIAYHPIRKIETLLPGDGQNSSACQIVAPDKKTAANG